ncbi:MAG: Rpn family recombination-promoting nuclease/putative transposase [Methanomicrobiales archaeon]|nr:Rpn family recombination-promoting nuclease/putative transposase [Methanomicrobiales archaeon]
MRFLDVKTDFAFKKVFGSEGSKDILLSFINAVIHFDGHRIDSLEIIDPYQIPLIEGMKDSYVDVKAKLDDGTYVIIEMQVLNVEGLEQRILYNAAKSYSTQIVKGKKYASLMPVVALTITDFIMFNDFNDVRSEYRMKEVKHLREYNGDLRLVFYELPKYTKTIEELKTLEDKWLYFVKEAGSLEIKPATLASIPEIEHALNIANEAGLSCQELEMQHRRQDFIILQQGSIDKAKNDGLNEGRVEGRAEGLKEGETKGRAEGLKEGETKGRAEERFEARAEIIKHMKAIGITTDEITRLTGLSEDEIEKIV